MWLVFCLIGCYSFSDKESHDIMTVMPEIIKTAITYPLKNTSAILIFMSV